MGFRIPYAESSSVKLVIEGNPSIIQGLVSISDRGDHVFINLIESARLNRGQEKMYKGVAGNLFAFACSVAFELGYKGFVAFYAKTRLIEHYSKTLNAIISVASKWLFRITAHVFSLKSIIRGE